MHGKRVAAVESATEGGEQKSVLLGFRISLVAEPFAPRSILIDELGDVEFVGTRASSRYREALEVIAAERRTTGHALLEALLAGRAESRQMSQHL
ncbi:MAG: hypothetical protein GY926_12940 [bacterium]|nr:hypothetical protein [bacterium]MCP4966126.1 hypothetical protein [bacterium]